MIGVTVGGVCGDEHRVAMSRAMGKRVQRVGDNNADADADRACCCNDERYECVG